MAKPRQIFLFTLPEIPFAANLHRLLLLSDKYLKIPFYVRGYQKPQLPLPPEPAEDPQDYERASNLITPLVQQFIFTLSLSDCFPIRKGMAYSYPGWHLSASFDELRDAFQSSGFQVLTSKDVFFPDTLYPGLEMSYRLQRIKNKLLNQSLPGAEQATDLAAIEFIVHGTGFSQASKALSQLLAKEVADHPSEWLLDSERRLFESALQGEQLPLILAQMRLDWWESPEKLVLPILHSYGIERNTYLRSLALARASQRRRSELRARQPDTTATELLLAARDNPSWIYQGDQRENNIILKELTAILKLIREKLPLAVLPKFVAPPSRPQAPRKKPPTAPLPPAPPPPLSDFEALPLEAVEERAAILHRLALAWRSDDKLLSKTEKEKVIDLVRACADPHFVPILRRLIQGETKKDARKAAYWIVDSIAFNTGSQDAVDALYDWAKKEPLQSERAELLYDIAQVHSQHPHVRIVDPGFAISLVHSTIHSLRGAAIKALAASPTPEAETALLDVIATITERKPSQQIYDGWTYFKAAESLVHIATQRSEGPILALLEATYDKSFSTMKRETRAQCVAVLDRIAPGKHVPLFLQLLKENAPNVRWQVLRAFARHPDPSTSKALQNFVKKTVRSKRPAKEHGALPLFCPTMSELLRSSARGKPTDDKSELSFALEALHRLQPLQGSSLLTFLEEQNERLYPSEQFHLKQLLSSKEDTSPSS